ncbi:hypothetical protein SLE2022_034980 [Rubroshorea leprosula]
MDFGRAQDPGCLEPDPVYYWPPSGKRVNNDLFVRLTWHATGVTTERIGYWRHQIPPPVQSSRFVLLFCVAMSP